MSNGALEVALDRRKLARSPLVNVIWQIQFTSDVSIHDGRAAMSFQSGLRHNTSLLPARNEGVAFQLSLGQLAGAQPPADPGGWRMIGEEGQPILTLAPGVLTLETNRYGSWDTNFEGWVRDVTRALEATLSPGLTTRVGLRYVNVLFAKALGIDEFEKPQDLAEYVHGSLLGFSVESQDVDITMIQGRQVLSIEDVSVNLNHALVRAETGEVGMLIDVDSYVEQAIGFDLEGVIRRTNTLHDVGLSVFQRCVTPAGWNAMGPIDDDQEAKS